VGGILRDVFTMGARPIAIGDALCFGSPREKMRYLVNGVVSGIGHYGNCFGAPTVCGHTVSHPSYDGNILVNAFALGVVKKDGIFLGEASGVGNPVIYVGAKTGRDGIHGATMASESFDDESEQKRPTVQVGDPFMEKLLLEACLEAMKLDGILGIQDMGAAGLTSSSVEMASRSGTGVHLNLDKVPLRAAGMTPYEIMLSESQERMLLVCEKGKEESLFEVFRRWELDACVVGEVTNTGKLTLNWHGEEVAALPIDALVEAAPKYDRPQKAYDLPAALPTDHPDIDDANSVLTRMLAHPDVASKRWIYEQYDHEVRLNTLRRPGKGDAAVVNVPNTGRAVAISIDCQPRKVRIAPFAGGARTICEAAMNVAAVGAKPLAVTDCMNFGNPERPEIMWQFAQCVDGMAKACGVLKSPVISGNVSLYNETNERSIDPTPMVGMVGLFEDRRKHVGSAFGSDQVILLLGAPATTTMDLGGSLYAETELDKNLPLTEPDLESVREVCNLMPSLVRNGVVAAAHDVSDGGVAVALAEMCIAGRVGANVALPRGDRMDVALFGEPEAYMIVACERQQVDALEAAAEQAGVMVFKAGRTGGDSLSVSMGGKTLVDLPVQMLADHWQNGFTRSFDLES
jgi:phosphoribosylformylglycinamidine synthase